ncbi:MAG TPA: nicotinate phosphoribosyltransferase [Bacteroidota bacterium]
MNESHKRLAEGMLFTDHYQFTMAQLYFRMGLHERKVQFDYFFREYPNYGTHQAGFCVFAGMEWLIEWMQTSRCTDKELAYLEKEKGRGGKETFDKDFLQWLREGGNFDRISLRSIAEGRVVHPHEPLAIVEGPLAAAQLLETSLLNHLNYQTLVATKAARIREVGRGQMFLEFGMRRGHERGVLAGARAALIGGADYSSNVGISHALGISPQGTHAHSMVQVFLTLGMSELDAFQAYADVYPDDCLLLVDTINTLESGIPNAIRIFERLKEKGHRPVGIRLDSGDLAYLSIQAAKMLNAAGFPDVMIALSNDLDELTILQIIAQITEEGPQHGVDPDELIHRLAYGVGTRLITSAGDSALGGVYKLVSVWDKGQWTPAIKISESQTKIPTPGNKQVWRIYDRREKAVADLVGLREENLEPGSDLVLHHVMDVGASRTIPASRISRVEPLLRHVFVEGVNVLGNSPLEAMRDMRRKDIDHLDAGVKRLINPHIYHISISQKLFELKQSLIQSVKAKGAKLS